MAATADVHTQGCMAKNYFSKVGIFGKIRLICCSYASAVVFVGCVMIPLSSYVGHDDKHFLITSVTGSKTRFEACCGGRQGYSSESGRCFVRQSVRGGQVNGNSKVGSATGLKISTSHR